MVEFIHTKVVVFEGRNSQLREKYVFAVTINTIILFLQNMKTINLVLELNKPMYCLRQSDAP